MSVLCTACDRDYCHVVVNNEIVKLEKDIDSHIYCVKCNAKLRYNTRQDEPRPTKRQLSLDQFMYKSSKNAKIEDETETTTLVSVKNDTDKSEINQSETITITYEDSNRFGNLRMILKCRQYLIGQRITEESLIIRHKKRDWEIVSYIVETYECQELKQEVPTVDQINAEILSFATQIAKTRSWSSPDFVIPENTRKECAECILKQIELGPNATDTLSVTLKLALGSTRFEKYGNDLITNIFNLHVSLCDGDDDNTNNVTKHLEAKSPAARVLFDDFHRKMLIEADPTSPQLSCRVVVAPAGGGKSSLLLSIVSAWPEKRFLLVSFSKDLCNDMMVRANNQNLHNIRVRTFDSLTKEAAGDAASEFFTNINDVTLVQQCYPRCATGRMKGSSGMAKVLDYALHSPVTTMKRLKLCEKHSRFSYAVEGILNKRPGGCGLSLCNSFTGCRRQVFTGDASLSVKGVYDVVLVDEVQDLDAAAVTILRRLGVNIVFVGDPNQEIYSFQDRGLCQDCKKIIDDLAIESCKTARLLSGANLLRSDLAIPLYGTFRLSQLSCEFVEDCMLGQFKAVSKANRSLLDVRQGIFEVSELPRDIIFTLLCRSNIEVIRMALEYENLGVVGGLAISQELELLGNRLPKKLHKRKIWSSMEKFAHENREGNTLDQVCQHLSQAATTLEEANRRSLICTVHRSKGAEFCNSVVTKEVFMCMFDSDAVERNVGFVAVSRHFGSLRIWKK